MNTLAAETASAWYLILNRKRSPKRAVASYFNMTQFSSHLPRNPDDGNITGLRFAAKGTAFEALEPNLEGPTALAVSKTDATAPARILANFAKTADKLELKGGVVEGTYYDAKAINVIASIPSREVLLGRLLGSMQSPIANFARVINQIAEKNGSSAEA